MDIVKLSGFAEYAKANDVHKFLKPANVKKYSLHLALETSGENRNKFIGVSFVIVRNKFDCSSILTLRNRRYQSNFIDVGRSSVAELKNYNLYPCPDPSLFETNEEIEEKISPTTISINADSNLRSTIIPSDDDNKLNSPQPTYTENFKGLAVDYTRPTVIQKSEINDVLNDIEDLKNSFKTGTVCSLKEYHYSYFIKLFYVDPEISTEEVVEFLKLAAQPLILFFGGFMIGPHAGKTSGEIYACFSSTLEALAALKLSSLTLGRYKVALILPTKLEIDNAIYNEVHEAIAMQYNSTMVEFEAPNIQSLETENEKRAANILEAMNECINVESTMAPDILTNVQPKAYSKVINDVNQDVVCETLVLIKNSPLRTVRSDLIRFFDGFKINESTIRKLNHNKDNTEWVVAFPSYQDAVRAIKKNNYKLIKGRTIELVLMT